MIFVQLGSRKSSKCLKSAKLSYDAWQVKHIECIFHIFFNLPMNSLGCNPLIFTKEHLPKCVYTYEYECDKEQWGERDF